MKRREFSLAALGALAAGQWPAIVHAQQLGTMKMMIPANPGGGWDQTGRALAQAMQSAKVVQSVQFDNKGGAAGTIGLAQFVNSAKGDPNAVMIGGMVMVGGIALNKSPVDLSMVTPIARLTSEWEVIVVPAASPLKSMAELVKMLKENPGKVSWGGGSAGGTDHILLGMIAKAVGVPATKISYVAFAGGGPAVAALLGAQVAAGISGYGEFAEQIKAGKLRALAISADKRLPGLDVPTLKEQGIDVELFNWRGVFAPPGVTDEQRKAMVALMDKMAASPEWAEACAKRDWTRITKTGDAYKAFIDAEIVRLEAVLKDLGIG
jgi:putative tricarboxylic transport membrane protein